ncbi:hypothetical protein [Calidifontibacter indicus]|uniref:hypothetical protein n=1 Tax=Calidifontibacter indicus TaxID=419650 RepID=UPI003D7278B2
MATLPVLCTMPTHVALRFAAALDLTVCEPPIPLPPYDINLIWHAAAGADPAHQWFRGVVIDAVDRAVSAGDPPAAGG